MLQTVPYGLLEMSHRLDRLRLQKPMLELELEKRLGAICGQTSLSSSPETWTSSAPAFGETQSQSTLGGLEGPVRLNRHLDTVIMRAFDQRLVELQERLSSGEHGEGRLSAIPQTRICSTSASARSKVPPPGPSVPTKSVSQKRQMACARCRSCPLQRLQPVKRTNTARRPLWTPSPWRVRKTSLTVYAMCSPLSVRDRVALTQGFEGSQAQHAGVALTTGGAVLVDLVTRTRQPVVDPELEPRLDDLRLGQLKQGRMNLVRSPRPLRVPAFARRSKARMKSGRQSG